jgi:putative DNA primase/helicase
MFQGDRSQNSGRVDVIWLFHVGMLYIPCSCSLSIEECHNILPCERTSTPLRGIVVRNSAGSLGPGLDVRGTNGYCVAPPSKHISGNQYRWKVDPRAVEIAPCPEWIYKSNGQKKKSRAGKPSELIKEGTRDDTLTSIAGLMRSGGMEYEDICSALQKINEKRCKPPLPDKDVERISRGVSGYEPGAKSPIQAAKNNKPWKSTDLRNAKRLVHYFGHNIRYCGEWGKWLIWNGSRWTIDENGEIFRYAYKTTDKLWDECKAATDSDMQSSISKWAIASQTRTKIDGMIYLARSLPKVAVDPESLDQDPMLLNCTNGTVDLRDGKLKPYNRANMITHMCPVKYEEKSSCILWKKFLDRIMNKNEVLIGYLQRLCG